MTISDNPFLLNFVRVLLGNNKKMMQKIIPLLNLSNEEYLLDIGCGTGCFSNVPCRYLGLDIDEKSIMFAKKIIRENERRGFRIGSAANLSYLPSKSFDKTMCLDLFHHLTDMEIRKTLAEIVRLTKKSILIVDSLKEQPLLTRFFMIFDNGGHFYSANTIKKFVQEFIEIKIIRIEKIGLWSEIIILGKPK